MPDPNNPLSYMSQDELALMGPGDVGALPPGVAQQILRQQLQAQALRNRASAPAQGAGEFDNFAFLESLTPEEQQQQQGLGTLDERGQLLDAQLAQARALQNQPTAQRGTVGGAIGSGLAGVLDTVRGGLQERDVRGQQQALLGQKDAGRTAYAEALRRFIQQRRQQVPATAGMGEVPLLPPGMG